MFKDKYKLITPSSKELDLTNYNQIYQYFNKKEFDYVINFAGYTNVDEAEKEKALCLTLNENVAFSVAKLCKSADIPHIYISSDFVFKGLKGDITPYKEERVKKVNPLGLSWYGYTKLKGEWETMHEGGNWNIVRISYPYRKSFNGKLDFARNILKLYQDGTLYPLFNDQFITPTFIDEACEALLKIVELNKFRRIYHVASTEVTTPYEFACGLLKTHLLKVGSFTEYMKYGNKTLRTQYGGLDCTKTQKLLGMEFHSWKDSIKNLQ